MPINKPSQPLIPAEIDPAVLDGKADLVNGEVPADQLPSYVDDVLEFADASEFPAEGEEGKIYVALDTNFTYRWSGSAYIQINEVDLSNYYTKGEDDNLLATKQGVINDLDTIRSGAAAGSTAVQPSSLASVATSGSYNDLINKPTILSTQDVQDMINASIDDALEATY